MIVVMNDIKYKNIRTMIQKHARPILKHPQNHLKPLLKCGWVLHGEILFPPKGKFRTVEYEPILHSF